MQVTFRRSFPVPPDAVWPWLTLPEEMNRWSQAKVVSISKGPEGRDDEAGAFRRVAVRAFGISSELEEEVMAAERPNRFVYQVRSGGGVRGHEGVITLTPTDGGTDLNWQVTFGGCLPGMGLVMVWIVKPKLEASLTVLEGLLKESGQAEGA